MHLTCPVHIRPECCMSDAFLVHTSLPLSQVFGKMVEETEGSFGVVFIYVLTALGELGA